MPDDPRNDNDTSNFDDWLAEESAPATDPFAADSTDPDDGPDATAEIDVVDSEGPLAERTNDDEVVSEEDDATEAESGTDAIFRPPGDDDSLGEPVIGDPDETEPSDGDVADPDDLIDTGEIEATDPQTDSEQDAGEDSTEDAAEPLTENVDDLFSPSAPVVEFEAFDGGDEPDTGELEIIAPEQFAGFDVGESEAVDAEVADAVQEADDVAVPTEPEKGSVVDFGSWDDPTGESGLVDTFEGAVPYDFAPSHTDTAFDPFEDTGEAVFVGGAEAEPTEPAGVQSFADIWSGDSSTGEADSGEGGGEDSEDFDPADNDLLLGATREHVGLAAAIAAAETEETAHVALVAEIPGLESSVVGFEDVVQAEGYRRVRARASGDLIARVVTGAILVLALGASLVWRPALVVFAVSVFVLGAGEFYTALVRSERKPISLFGFLGIVGACLGAFWWSAAAIPIAFILATVLLLLFYAVTLGKVDPMGNLALTMTVMVWAGLGSFALLIARSDDYQILILGVVVTVAAADIAAFFVGRSLGRTHFAHWVSPNKTVEGLVAGSLVAIGLGAGLHYFPPFELTSGLAIGAAAAVMTPLGDLAMSAAKRSLGLKDMGSVLPGHGGFLDRIDGLLFAIPAAWAIFVWAGLL